MILPSSSWVMLWQWQITKHCPLHYVIEFYYSPLRLAFCPHSADADAEAQGSSASLPCPTVSDRTARLRFRSTLWHLRLHLLGAGVYKVFTFMHTRDRVELSRGDLVWPLNLTLI